MLTEAGNGRFSRGAALRRPEIDVSRGTGRPAAGNSCFSRGTGPEAGNSRSSRGTGLEITVSQGAEEAVPREARISGNPIPP